MASQGGGGDQLGQVVQEGLAQLGIEAARLIGSITMLLRWVGLPKGLLLPLVARLRKCAEARLQRSKGEGQAALFRTQLDDEWGGLRLLRQRHHADARGHLFGHPYQSLPGGRVRRRNDHRLPRIPTDTHLGV